MMTGESNSGLERAGGVGLLRSAGLAELGVGAVFTARAGGVSSGTYASLNLGLHVGDRPEAVLENRRLLAGELGLDAADFVCAEQSHGARAAVVGEAKRGRGARRGGDGIPETDALLTDCRRLPLLLFAADCLLLALADRRGRAAAGVHASWRSTAAGIVPRAVKVMGEKFAVPAEDLRAWFSPHLRPCCYEVRDDMRETFLSARQRAGSAGSDGRNGNEGNDLFERREKRLFFRLGEAVRRDLRGAGLREQQIVGAEGCTACSPEKFFSHRRDGEPTGRMGLIVGLERNAAG